MTRELPRLSERYELKRRLGTGGMGTVYLARDTRLLRDVAVKVMESYEVGSDAFYAFHREARTIAQLRHPGIVQVFDYSGLEEQPPYIVMEYIEGSNLLQIAAQCGQPPDPVIFAMVLELSAALEYVHAQGILHRDIKPANIMLRPGGATLLTDFGVAKAYNDPARLGRTLVERATGFFGTPHYVAPEQVLEQVSSPDSDVFALGSTIYWMVAGASPFAEADPVRSLERTAKVDYTPLEVHSRGRSPEIYALVEGALQLHPMDRKRPGELHAICAQWLTTHRCRAPAALVEAYRTGAPLPGSEASPSAERTVVAAAHPESAASAQAPHPQRPRTLAVAAALVGALFFGLAGWLALKNREAGNTIPIAPVDGDPGPSRPETIVAPEPPAQVPPAPLPAARSERGRKLEPVASESVPSTQPSHRLASVQLLVRPWGAVYLDGELKGNTPVVRTLTAREGPHEIRIVHPAYGEVRRTVHFGKDAHLQIILEPR